jgi:three-Cys-motif partner protein
MYWIKELEMPKIAKTDTNPKYWLAYNNFQHVKHSLIRNYLNGWLPMLGSWSGKILYFDTHAGRGVHRGGQAGSPLVALDCVLNHSRRKSVFGKCQINFFFIEIDENNCRVLQNNIDELGPLPKRVKTEVVEENCFDVLTEIIEYLNESGNNLAPAFVFVDPYGFKIPGGILRELMAFRRVELFINIMWRELSMGIAQGTKKGGMEKTLNSIFDSDGWKDLIDLDFNDQAEECINLFRDMIDAKWATKIHMLGKNGATRYMLLHLTNHDAGRDLMKDCVWKVIPEGGYSARVSDNPNQKYLITPTPDLRPLRKWVIDRLRNEPTRWQTLIDDLRPEVWRKVQLNQIIRELRKKKIIDGRDYQGQSKFFPSNNPILFLV